MNANNFNPGSLLPSITFHPKILLMGTQLKVYKTPTL